MPPLEDIFIQTIISYINQLQTVKKILQVSKRIQRIIKTMKSNPYFICSAEEKGVRAFHIQNILNIFSGIGTLQITPEDLILDFNQWEINTINISITSGEIISSIPFKKLISYVGTTDEFLKQTNKQTKFPLERLYIIQPENIDVNALNCLILFPCLKFVEFCLIEEKQNSIFFTNELIYSLLKKNIKVIINHPEMNENSIHIRSLLPNNIYNIYSNVFPFGSFNNELIVISPQQTDLFHIYNPITNVFNNKLYKKLYYPYLYEGEYNIFLSQLDSLQLIELKKSNNTSLLFPSSLKELHIYFTNTKNYIYENESELSLLTTLKIKEYNKKTLIPLNIQKLVIDKLTSKFQVTLPQLTKLSIHKTNFKKLILNSTIKYLKLDYYYNNMSLPHSVKTLQLYSCDELLSTKKIEKLILLNTDNTNMSLLPLCLKNISLYNVKKINLTRLESLEEVYLNLNSFNGFFDFKNIKLPPNIKKLILEFTGKIGDADPQNIIDKAKLYFSLIPNVQMLGEFFE
ncbi:hypothetical protein EHI8A_081420 [Entamoeba histolytica HM-1:IMSS-B]|uniref:Uncharacterized protein n=5 Tax=Entamoeba histolytica TaxID=5759 RepID=C4LTS6_ENTH1|nr:hypothetical protein EHI_050530 [Entamoeba histolytica HM-1:IMSS]EMD45582.1 Hypothetical protein EHI5A_119000 [Entamoeba histolytica KU27]EMH77154.1 hypothetical protein EHI8A_081420 [Entamoeba histolytica HM-1:IMSS-B]EMS16313.1 hypothetical protein KM1_139180 [Entamoeba histolytica HM-3:IMSS]ENY65704.1 hypothetical protein EHI7A_077680 [Entamoeba histolytica HM-1:IMSS-A]EAL51220.1 hypothetical protein EHI_050530 [Entamoeba histolytica HM-1:IMSS]|eukprot:XP_656606.1 hypothetical protein EHI_050530 [Entamoeba histolytica HM-1:IMSS]